MVLSIAWSSTSQQIRVRVARNILANCYIVPREAISHSEFRWLSTETRNPVLFRNAASATTPTIQVTS